MALKLATSWGRYPHWPDNGNNAYNGKDNMPQSRYMLSDTQLIHLLTIAHNTGGVVVIERTKNQQEYTVSIPGETAERVLLADGTVRHLDVHGSHPDAA